MFLAKERQPIDDLRSQKVDINKKTNIYSDLKTKMKALKDAIKKFINSETTATLGAKTAKSSNEKIFTVDANSDAAIGVSTIFVSRLATRDTAVSKQFSNLSGTIAGAGLYGTTQEFDITVGSNAPVRISIEFNDENETIESALKRTVDAINNAGADVSANYIKDSPDSARISIVSNETGATNQITLEEVGTSSILRKLDIIDVGNSRPEAVGTGGGFIQVEPANLNASITLNGIEIISDTNTITDVLQGVTINLISAQGAGENPETISISHDSESIKSEIESFIEKYNEVITYLNEKTSVDTTTFTRGALTGEFAYTRFKMNLRSIISGPVSSVEEGAPNLLTSIGIKIDRSGTIKIDDSDKLQEYIDGGNSEIVNLFGSENGIANKIDSLLKNYVKTGGIVDDDKKMISTRIRNIDKRISSLEDRLAIREITLRRQFIDLQRMLSSLNSQQAMIQNSMSIFSAVSGGYSMGYY